MKSKETQTRTVGIAGSVKGSGVTHLAISLANYAASGRLEKCAYIEAGGQGELLHWKRPKDFGYFKEKRVHYYPDVKREDIPIILNRDYDKIIFDFGEKYLMFQEEILRCDQKIFLMNLNIWQKFAAEKLLRTLGEQDWGNFMPLFASAFASAKEKRRIEKAFHIHIMEITGIPDAFAISGESFSMMNRLLGENTPVKKKFKLNLTKRKK